MKICNKCLEEKPLSEFGMNKSCPDGHRGTCKGCVNARVREKRRRDREQFIQILYEKVGWAGFVR